MSQALINDQILEKHLADMNTAYDIVMNSHTENTEYIFQTLINQPEVLKLYSGAGSPDPQTADSVRNELYKMLLPYYEALSGSNIKQLHFHLPDNRSFLRFHRPNKYGDDLTGIRTSVELANSELREIKGFEEGRIFNGFRDVFPLYYQGKHIGSVELSTGFNHIRDHIAREFHNCYSFLMSGNIVKSKVFSDEIPNYVSSSLHSDFLFEKEYQEPDAINQINLKIASSVHDRMNDFEEFVISTRTGGDTWSIAFLPIRNVKNVPAAYFISYKKDSLLRTAETSFLRRILLFLVITGILFFLLHKYLKSIDLLQERQKQLLQAEMTGQTGHWTFERENRQLTISDGMFRILGIPEKQNVSVEEVKARVHPEDGEKISDIMPLPGDDPECEQQIEYRLLMPDGRLKYVMERRITQFENGIAVKRFGTIQDVTDIKIADQSLRTSLTRFRSLIDNIQMGVLVESEDRTVLQANSIFCRMFGIPGPDLMEGMNCQDAARGAADLFMDPDGFLNDVNGILKEKKDVLNQILLMKDGRTFERDYIPVTIDEKPLGNMWFYRDVTEKLADEKKRLMQGRLASVGQLAAGIAHEFNNMLMGVIGSADVIRHHVSTGESAIAYEYLDNILKVSDKAALMVRQIQDFGRRTMMNTDTLDLSNELQSVVDILTLTMPDKYRISYERTSDGKFTALFDKGLFRQVIMNIVNNAGDAMSAGGDIQIKLSKKNLAGEDRCLYCNEAVEGKWLVIEISDEGHGIPEKLFGQIFEPFFTTREIFRHPGLGLSQVLGIIVQTDSHIRVSSLPGEGTIFTLYIKPVDGD